MAEQQTKIGQTNLNVKIFGQVEDTFKQALVAAGHNIVEESEELDNVVVGHNSGVSASILKGFLDKGTHVLLYKADKAEYNIAQELNKRVKVNKDGPISIFLGSSYSEQHKESVFSSNLPAIYQANADLKVVLEILSKRFLENINWRKLEEQRQLETKVTVPLNIQELNLKLMSSSENLKLPPGIPPGQFKEIEFSRIFAYKITPEAEKLLDYALEMGYGDGKGRDDVEFMIDTITSMGPPSLLWWTICNVKAYVYKQAKSTVSFWLLNATNCLGADKSRNFTFGSEIPHKELSPTYNNNGTATISFKTKVYYIDAQGDTQGQDIFYEKSYGIPKDLEFTLRDSGVTVSSEENDEYVIQLGFLFERETISPTQTYTFEFSGGQTRAFEVKL